MVSDKKVFPTKSNKWVSLAHKPMFPDNKQLEKVFKDRKEICLLNLPPAERKPSHKGKTGNAGKRLYFEYDQRCTNVTQVEVDNLTGAFKTDSAERQSQYGACLQREWPLFVPEDLRDPSVVKVCQDWASDREPEALSVHAGHGALHGALHPEVPLPPRRALRGLFRAGREQHQGENQASLLWKGQQFSSLKGCLRCFLESFWTINQARLCHRSPDLIMGVIRDL